MISPGFPLCVQRRTTQRKRDQAGGSCNLCSFDHQKHVKYATLKPTWRRMLKVATSINTHSTCRNHTLLAFNLLTIPFALPMPLFCAADHRADRQTPYLCWRSACPYGCESLITSDPAANLFARFFAHGHCRLTVQIGTERAHTSYPNDPTCASWPALEVRKVAPRISAD
jgi:hypothetical protein